MSPLAWWRSLPQNPIYLREKGMWGKPNPFYDNLSRYSPFVIIGTITLGACAGISNSAVFGLSDELFIFWCLLCMPGVLLSILTLYGSLMAPALTAPSVSSEINRGTWDMLRVTPFSTRDILLFKLVGGLSRLRFWPALLVLSLIQGVSLTCLLSLGGGALTGWSWLLGLSALTRPWLEILFAATLGMYLSTRVRSATVALVGSYSGILTAKVLNSSTMWTLVSERLTIGESVSVLYGAVGPALVYAAGTIVLWLGLARGTGEFSYG